MESGQILKMARPLDCPVNVSSQTRFGWGKGEIRRVVSNFSLKIFEIQGDDRRRLRSSEKRLSHRSLSVIARGRSLSLAVLAIVSY